MRPAEQNPDKKLCTLAP